MGCRTWSTLPIEERTRTSLQGMNYKITKPCIARVRSSVQFSWRLLSCSGHDHFMISIAFESYFEFFMSSSGAYSIHIILQNGQLFLVIEKYFYSNFLRYKVK
jgi:hypothetical protein